MPRFFVRAALFAALVATLMSVAGCNIGNDTIQKRILAIEDRLSEPRVQKLSVVDKNDKERISFGMREDGTPEMRMIDPDGNNRVLIRMHADGTPIIVLFGPKTKGSAYLSVPATGEPQMMFFDASGAKTFAAPR